MNEKSLQEKVLNVTTAEQVYNPEKYEHEVCYFKFGTGCNTKSIFKQSWFSL